METIYVGAKTRVPMSLLDTPRVIEELTVRNKTVEAKIQFGTPLAKGDELETLLYEIDGDSVLVPRGYPLPLVSEDYEVVDERPVRSFPTNRLFHGKLRPNQILPAQILDSHAGEDKMLCLGCGKGKTFMALRYFHRNFGGRMLAIVDREFVADQWIKAIKKHCFTHPSQVGYIGSGKKPSVGDRFTVAIVHTLAQNPELYDEAFFDQFELVVPDEAHVMAARTFRDVISRAKCERLALTATPDRKDGQDPVVRLHTGGPEPVYVDVERTMPCTWVFKKLPPLIKGFDLKRCYKKVWGQKRYNPETEQQEDVFALMRPRYETMASKNATWFNIIMRDLRKAVESGRQIILLGGRTEQLDKLVSALREEGISAGIFVGGMKKSDSDESLKAQVICATWQKASRALDVTRLDTLFLLFPTNDPNFLRQASGRIDDRASTGTKKPLVVTYTHAPLDSREEWFEKTGYGRRGATQEMLETLTIVDKDATIRFVNATED